ncbi:MAG: competence/damage-inducible protein A [Solirubrobacterales bacterium]|nr:competence/damage-inducible protein A [Solirubrobacterales bacterium]
MNEGLPGTDQTVKAGILVTGTEVLQATIRDENGPWLSERLAGLGIELVATVVVADHREAVAHALGQFAGLGADLVITTGGLGPTADDLTAEVVADFCRRPLALDPAMENRIGEILARFARSSPAAVDRAALDAANRKQALVPTGAVALDPVGTAPGLIVPPRSGGGPLVLVLPGPPRELRPMWEAALEEPLMRDLIGRASPLHSRHLRMFGTPESELAMALREIEADGTSLEPLEVTTCLRRGEVEIDIRYRPGGEESVTALTSALAARFPRTLYSRDGTTIDRIVADLLGGHRLAVAESCSAGLLAARVTDLPGASAYFAGGVVSYSNRAKQDLLGVDPGLIAREGAVSEEVARAMAVGALDRFDADVAVAITGIAGPDGGSEEKPVGLVHFNARTADGREKAAAPVIPGGRNDVRERAALVAMHLLRWLLGGSGTRAAPPE